MFKKVLPLLSIFALIIIMTVITAVYKDNFSLMHIMMMSMGYFFLIFGLFKINNLKGFANAYAMYDILAMKSKTYALVYPFIEIALGLLYLFSIGGIYRDIVTLTIMSISAYGVWKVLRVKGDIQCACLGTVFKVPMTKVTLFENLLMALMALYMIITYFNMGSMSM